jgi:hypothetical protein
MLKYVILFQLCFPLDISKPYDVSCVRIMSDPIYTTLNQCEDTAREVSSWLQDELDQAGGASVLYAQCVTTYTMDYLYQFK